MKRIIKTSAIAIGLLFCTGTMMAQKNVSLNKNQKEMKTYVIEREIPGASKLTAAELKAIAQKSCAAIKEVGAGIEWLHSYVAGDKFYCIYKAENEELVRAHARKGGFPANLIVEVASICSPATAEN